MMDAPVDAVDDEAEPFAELIGQPLVDDAADDRRRERLAVERIAPSARSSPCFASARLIALTMSPRSPSSLSVGSNCSDSFHTPGSVSMARP